MGLSRAVEWSAIGEAKVTTIHTPSRRVLLAATRSSQILGHENLGFLSPDEGFLPSRRPLRSMPASHRAWDQLADALPRLFTMLRVRPEMDQLPVLDTSPENLPDEYLLRASTLLGIFAHAYYSNGVDVPTGLPAAVRTPWEGVTSRLGRPAPHLSYIDLIANNWRVTDGSTSSNLVVENLELMVPTLNNPAERIFYLTQVEILAEFRPVLGAMVRAQEAVQAKENDWLEHELLLIAERLEHIADVSLVKLNPNSSAAGHMDPAMWAKTVAPFAVPFDPDVAGPNGTSSPMFHALDAFFGRNKYQTRFGEEMADLRSRWFPPNWREFVEALEKVSVRDGVLASGCTSLGTAFADSLAAYSGRQGFLDRHRVKVYGYLDLAFKLGRTTTIGRFAGVFKDRTWDDVDAELSSALQERREGLTDPVHEARIETVVPLKEGDGRATYHVVLDVAGTGIKEQPGDRCAIWPENETEAVERVLLALGASGDEAAELDKDWRDALSARTGSPAPTHTTLRQLLQLGRIRPVDRGVAAVLFSLTRSEKLRAILRARAEDQWELWDILELLGSEGAAEANLWNSLVRDLPGGICRVVKPEFPRMYSISLARRDQLQNVSKLELTVGLLSYETTRTEVSAARRRLGTASSFLTAGRASGPDLLRDQNRTVKFALSRSTKLRLPKDASAPVVMFAGGTGLSPFRAFLHQRRNDHGRGRTLLFVGARTLDEVYYFEELRQFVEEGWLDLSVALSREDLVVSSAEGGDGAGMDFAPGPRRYIDREMRSGRHSHLLRRLLEQSSEGAAPAHLYVCGHSDFAHSVTAGIEEVIADGIVGSRAEKVVLARQRLAGLAARGHYVQEVYSTYPGAHPAERRTIPISEIVLHNCADRGHWMVIDDRVLDVSGFTRLHQGGSKILEAYSGMDASAVYRRVLHNHSPEVNAQLAQYVVGVVDKPRLLSGGSGMGVPKDADARALCRAWIELLYCVVEMENTLRIDDTVQSMPLTPVSYGDEPSLLRLKLFRELHERVAQNYVEALSGNGLAQLWQLALKASSNGEDANWAHEELARIHAKLSATLVRGHNEFMAGELSRLSQSTTYPVNRVHEIERQCAILAAEGARFLRNVKSRLRLGMQILEESCPSGNLADRLLPIVKELCSAVEEYYDSICHLLELEEPPGHQKQGRQCDCGGAERAGAAASGSERRRARRERQGRPGHAACRAMAR